MQTEIEAKFLNVNHDDVRAKLKALGAELDQPMRLMRRAILDYPDGRIRNSNHGRLRVRDEGNKITVTYKSKSDSQYSKEVETTVGSFDDMVALFAGIGLQVYSFQESKRETWQYKDVEVVLDEWPWLESYIEIEGPSEESIQSAAKDLGFDWQDAEFNTVDAVYQRQYPGMKPTESIGLVAVVRFDQPLPDFLVERQKI